MLSITIITLPCIIKYGQCTHEKQSSTVKHYYIHVRKKISIVCNRIEHRVHPQMRRYPPSTMYRYLDLPYTQIIQTHHSQRHNTTPHLQTLIQAPYPLPTYTTHTTTTNTRTHVLHFPSSHRFGTSQT